MVISPKTKVRLYSGIPIDPSYQNVLNFNTVDEQINYFNNRTIVAEFSNFNYIDETRELRVPMNMERLYNVNYIAYQNATFGNKWFYAFVNYMEYYSPESTAIFFTVDVYASWQFNLKFGKCFVLREHTNDDTIGANTIPENVELGPYVTTAQTQKLSTNLYIYMLASDTTGVELSGDWYSPTIVSGFPISCYFKQYGTISTETLGALKLDIDAFASAGKSDAIVSIFCAPAFTPPIIGGGAYTTTFPCASRTLNISPKNNKLYTFPYVSCSILCDGQSQQLRYELFNDTPTLWLQSTFGPNAQTAVYPSNYEGVSQSPIYEISLNKWPLLPWVSNYFQNWIAQNKATIGSSVVNSVIGAITNPNPVAGITGALTTAISAVGQTMSANVLPDKMEGSAMASDVNAITGISGFYTMCRAIKAEYATAIDNFFSMYGYRTNKLKYPNITGRSKWNFVQTSDPIIYGDCPKDTVETMQESLKRGITFWHNGEFEYGDLSNPII